MRIPRAFLGGLLAFGTAVHASAACYEWRYLAGRDGGSYTRDGAHNPDETELRAGGVATLNTIYPLRNWMIFDLPAFRSAASSASLYLPMYFPGQVQTLRFELFDVTTSLQVLTNGGTGLQSVYADLGEGTKLGEATLNTSDNGVTVNLNAAALAHLNTTANQTLALGGKLSTLTGNSNTVQLFASVFPGMATLALRHQTNGAPIFTQAPFDINQLAGNLVDLEPAVCGAEPMTYQWYRDGSPLTDATNLVLRFPEVRVADSGVYTVTASNQFGVVTGTVGTMRIDPVILQWYNVPPTPLYVGQSAYFQLHVNSVGPFTHLAVHNTTNVLESRIQDGFIIFEIPYVTPEHAGEYFVVVGNEYGVALSQPIYLNPIYSGPQIGSQSGSPIIVNATETTYLYANAVGGPPPTLQWYYGNELIGGATSSQLEIRFALAQHSGSYRLMASNEFGVAWSAPINLVVGTFSPNILSLPNLTAVEGGSAKFLPTIMASAPLSYQWFFNGVAMPGENRLELTLFNVAPSNAGTYRLDINQPVAASRSATLTVRPPGPLDRWTRLTPHPTATYLNDVIFEGGKFIAVGENGAVITSGPNNTWREPFSGNLAHIYSVAFGNGVYVAVAQDAILYSADGEHWSRAPFVFHRKLISPSVGFGNGRFLIIDHNLLEGPVGFEPVLTSTDGVTWQKAYTEVPAGYDSRIRFAAGRFFLFRFGEVHTSQDGVSWSLADNGWHREDIGFGNGLWVTVGSSGSVRTSTDLTNWTAIVTPVDATLLSVTYGNGKWVAVGARGAVCHSTDGANWAVAQPPNRDRLERVAFGNGRFLAVGEAGTMITSTDGANWALVNSGVTSDMEALTTGPAGLVAVGKEGWILTSTNGADFTAHYSGDTNLLHDVVYANGQYLGIGDQGRVARSLDGVNWTNSVLDPSAYLKGVTYGEGRFVTVGSNGRIFYSTDGVQWLPRDPAIIFYRDFNSVAYGNDVFIAAGDNGSALYSEDGFQWYYASPQGGGVNFRDVVFVNNRFILAGNDGIVYSSPNGYTWTFHDTGVRQDGMNLRSITYAHGIYIIVGNRGLVLTSPDLLTWQVRKQHTFFNLHGVQPWGDRFVAIGNGGTALLSDSIQPWLHSERRANALSVFLEGEPMIYGVQSSSNLINWTHSGFVTNVRFSTFFQVPAAEGSRFFRAVTP